jgi:uncharacterized protein
VNRRRFLQVAAIGTAAAAVGTVGYTLAVEPHWLEITERELSIAQLPDALLGARLVQLSDLHIGPQVSDVYLRDVLTDFPKGRIATLGILGNHDYGTNWRDVVVASKVVAEAERAGIRMLRNETHAVNGLDVIGVDDLWARQSDTARAFAARSNDAALVLVHNPDAADKLAWPDYRGWMLSGHTHGGQCKAPFLPPPLLPVENKRYVAGAVRVDDARTLYISRGVGHLIPARFNVRPEITVFTLRR